MKKTNTATAVGDCTTWCPTCRARASTGHPGPYTSAELMKFVIEPDRPERDPAIAAAETERDTARAVFDSFDITWQTALAAKTRADIHGQRTTAERRQLSENEAAAREQRDRSWAAVVKANEKLRQATLTAQETQRANAAP
jgi:hypothetical protein